MNRPQRFVLILYFLLIVYCCVWVPWHFVVAPANAGGTAQVRVGYGWLWSGPQLADSSWACNHTPHATPDLAIIGLRLLAATALGAASLAAARK